MERLRVLLFETPSDPYYNLAFEEAFYLVYNKLGGDPVLRIWRNKNAVIIGYFQKAEEEVHLDYAKQIGAEIVRRFTGGGAVYHDLGNINYAVTVKKNIGNVEEIYSFLIKGILYALKKLGVEPYLENINDVVVNNRKVSGTAATYRGETLFLHGALLVSTDLAKLSKVLKISKKKLLDKKVSSVKYRVALLQDILGRKITYHEIIDAIILGYSSLLNIEPYYDMPTQLEIEVADILYKEKYKTREWNYERKPLTYFKNIYDKINNLLS